jgi:hypothetical protein
MHGEVKLKLISHTGNTNYYIIEVVTKAGLTVLAVVSFVFIDVNFRGLSETYMFVDIEIMVLILT